MPSADWPPGLEDCCRKWLGAEPNESIFLAGGVSRVIGLRLSDGREVVVRIRRPEPRVYGCVQAQRHLWTSGYPCPEPLAGPSRFHGELATAESYVVGGEKLAPTIASVLPPAAGLPQWGPEMDYNVQQDIAAATIILSSSSPLLVPVGISMRAAIRKSHLARLRGAGALARLIARQAEPFDTEWHSAERYRSASSVPKDIINFCTIRWYAPLRPDVGPMYTSKRCQWCARCGDQLVERVENGGKALPVLTGLDGLALEAEWLGRVSGVALGSIQA